MIGAVEKGLLICLRTGRKEGQRANKQVVTAEGSSLVEKLERETDFPDTGKSSAVTISQ